MALHVEPLAIPDVKLIRPVRQGDERGYFSEVYNAHAYKVAGITHDFVQDNHSYSAECGVLRGLHLQTPPAAQAKLVRVGRGRIFDVAVDLRAGSETYGKWVGEELSAENGLQILIPHGFAHGFLTLEPHTEVLYKTDAHYTPACDAGLAWDDPDIAIDWALAEAPVLSKKDADQPAFAGFRTPFNDLAAGRAA